MQYLFLIVDLNYIHMTIIAVVSKNYKVSRDTMILYYFSNMEKAIAYAKQYLIDKSARDVSELLPPDKDNYKWNSRFEYNSHYGNYPCGLEFEEIEVL